jgi:hypothetical protein
MPTQHQSKQKSQLYVYQRESHQTTQPMTHYRLEYNPDDGKLFHMGMDNNTHQQNTFGWTTIDERAENRTATRFIAYFKKYHMDKKREQSEVKSMWKMFQGIE